MIHTRTLADVEAWHAWAREQLAAGLHVGYRSPPEFPCVVAWHLTYTPVTGRPVALSYAFVARRDFPNE
jgi:hypothetical protein